MLSFFSLTPQFFRLRAVHSAQLAGHRQWVHWFEVSARSIKDVVGTEVRKDIIMRSRTPSSSCREC